MYRIEGHDINSSGWDYTSASSFVTISFWIKSSVAQTFYLRFRMTGSSVVKEYVSAINATTSWQKITKTIPGGTGVDSVNTTAEGGFIQISLFRGTDQTGSMTIDQWNTHDSSTKVPDMTSTWYTTNDATLEITGVQLEVGSVATPYEHKKRSQELADRMRYYQIVIQSGGGGGGNTGGLGGTPYTNGSSVYCPYRFPVEMRAEPSVESTSGTGSGSGTFRTRFGNNYNFNNFSGFNDANNTSGTFITNGNAGGGDVGQYIWIETNAGAKLALDAEL